jgi:hypothetical protein
MNALGILQYGNLTFVKTVQAVPLAERDEPGVCGVWSVKDIIAHLASFEILLTDVFSIFLDGGPTPTLDQWLNNSEAFNHHQVLRRSGNTAREVLTEYLEIYDGVRSMAAQIPAAIWQMSGILPWHGGQYSLSDFIVYQYYGHKREHSAEIAAFLNQITRRAQHSIAPLTTVSSSKQ